MNMVRIANPIHAGLSPVPVFMEENDTRKLLFAASCHGYDEGWDMTIFEQDGKLWYYHLFSMEGYGDDNTREITQDEALKLMFECAEYEDPVPEWFW